MRIDLSNNRRRPLPAQWAMNKMAASQGSAPPPLLFFTYAPTLLGLGLIRYLAQGLSHPGPWTHGED
jgi:hypothetical protein